MADQPEQELLYHRNERPAKSIYAEAAEHAQYIAMDVHEDAIRL